LPYAAQTVLNQLTWRRKALPQNRLLTTLTDLPREGDVRTVIRDRIRTLEQRLKREV